MQASGAKKGIVCIIALMVLVFLFLLAEFFARRHLSYVIEERIEDGKIDTFPSGIYLQTPRGPRLPKNADLVVKNHYLSERDIHIRTNAHGFRDEEIGVPKPKGVYRILALGDSITFGDALERSETWVERLESLLNERSNTTKVEVINAGLSGLGTREEVDILIERGLALDPDLVLLGFYLNDARPSFGFREELVYRNWIRRNSVLIDHIYKSLVARKLLRQSGENLFEWVYRQKNLDWKTKREDFLSLAYSAKVDWGNLWFPDDWPSILSEWERLAEIAEHEDFDVFILLFPVFFQVHAEFLENAPQVRALKEAESMGFQTLDILPLLREYRGESLSFDHCHPNSRGNEIISRALAKRLESKIDGVRKGL